MKLEFTLNKFISHIKKNGLPQVTGATFRSKEHPEFGACALGQGLWNVLGQPEAIRIDEGVFWGQFNNQLRDIKGGAREDEWGLEYFTESVVRRNDSEKKDIPTIVKEVKKQFKDHLDRKIVIELPDSPQ